MYKLSIAPALFASVHELADFAEVTAWKHDSASRNTLA